MRWSRVLAVAVMLVPLAGCGADQPGAGESPAGTPSGSGSPGVVTPTMGAWASAGPGGKLTFTRPDGSTFVLSAGKVVCGPVESDPNRLRIIATSTQDPGTERSAFMFEAIVAEVAAGATFTLPHTYLHGDPHGVSMFAVDEKTSNELNSNQEEARGTIVVKRAACDPAPAIEVSMDATLGSEFHDGEDVAVKGSFALYG